MLDLLKHQATLLKRPMMIVRTLLNLSRTAAVHTGNGDQMPLPQPDDPVSPRRRVFAKRPSTAAEEDAYRQERMRPEPAPELCP